MTSLLSVGKVAAHLACSAKHVYALIARRHLRAYRVGGLLRVSPDDLEAYLESVRTASDGPAADAAEPPANTSEPVRKPRPGRRRTPDPLKYFPEA